MSSLQAEKIWIYPKDGRSGVTRAHISSLPPELQILISKNLTYPDALSLKHTCRTFYTLVYTGINLKIEWLIERRRLHLDCPNDRKCELGSDLRFCRGSVSLLMKRRREHGECDSTEGGRGCLVFGTPICTSRKRHSGLRGRLKIFMGRATDRDALYWWVLASLVGVILSLCCR
ncbi:hypothetical protein B0O99DRAFT_618288 [Bisporella sp. PMI_857]|nr:hypothetical protein B0O99DRAFT_618288 [Bisporella sp. PMI_857]